MFSPKEQSLAQQVQGNDTETEKYGSAPSWLVTCRGGCMTGQVWVASGSKASLHGALQQNISVKRHSPSIFPVFPSVTRYGAFPAPGGTRRSASRCARPSGLGFQTKNLPRRSTRGSGSKTGEIFSSEPPQKDTPSALGSGAPRVASRKSVPRAIRANTKKEK
jgi:hypothetical protein